MSAEELFIAQAPKLAEDFLLALRYHYYVKARSLVPDAVYDAAERDYMERPTTDTFSSMLSAPGSDNPDSYPDRVKALALYLAFDDHDKLVSHQRRKALQDKK